MVDARVGDELKPYIVTAADGGMELAAIEFRHPQFLDGGNPDPIRIVFDDVDRLLPHEAAAPVDPSTSVTYRAIPARFAWPERAENIRPRVIIEIEDVTFEVIQKIHAVDLGSDPISVIVREYAPDGTGPYRVIDTLTVHQIAADEGVVNVICEPAPAQAELVPRHTYQADEFPLR